MALCGPCHEAEAGDEQIIDVETQHVLEEHSAVQTARSEAAQMKPVKELEASTTDTGKDEKLEAPCEDTPEPGWECGESFASKFHMDLEAWVTESSEAFHWRIFFIELLGQMSWSVFGPLSIPLLLCIYGGKVGLENRAFWPSCKGGPPTVVGLIVWATFFAGIIANFFSPKGVMLIEIKFAIFSLFMRNLPIATKYAYTSSQTWESFNRKYIDNKYRAFQNMLVGWYMIPEENFALQAEVAFVGVIGSHAQRSDIKVKFLPWPRNELDLLALRKRVDVSSKTMFFAPTGEVLRPKSCRRKAARKRIVGRQESSEGLREMDMQGIYDGITAFKSQSRRSLGRIRGVFHTNDGAQSPQETKMPMTMPQSADPVNYQQEEDAKLLFQTAAAGGEVPIEDLFLYFLRAVQSSEKAMSPPIVKLNLLLTIPVLLIPSFVRWMNTGYFVGPDGVAVIAVVCLWPSNFQCLLSSLCFIGVGALDMWRRRALMRSCAAMLSVQREFRRHCPAEVDMLPVMDFTDVKTIAGWRKLRQLCHEWGKFYHLRIRAFSAQFFAFLCLILGDLVVGMLVPEYTDLSGVNLASLSVAGLVSCSLMASIFMLVYLGNEVNEAAERHRFILNRQRSLLVAMKHDDASRQLTPLECGKEKLEKATDLMASISDELESESKVTPLTLLGMPLGYSLLSFLNFIPIGVLSTLVQFCGNENTAHRCIS